MTDATAHARYKATASEQNPYQCFDVNDFGQVTERDVLRACALALQGGAK